MHYYLDPLKKYAQFKGRATRKEFWMFYLLYMLSYILLYIIDSVVGADGGIGGIYVLATIIPWYALTWRRMHDTNNSGWMSIIPIYGFILTLIDGTKGPNRFGPDPKGRQSATPVPQPTQS